MTGAMTGRAHDLVPGPGRRAHPGDGPADTSRKLGVYVHFPFCGVRCPYCDFAIDVRADIPHERYARAVGAELRARAPWFKPQAQEARLVSVYFGGGTPGLWAPEALGSVLETARTLFSPSVPADVLEITVEANPGEVSLSHLEALRRQGVNRISFGIQAFDDRLLRTLGRGHDRRQALEAIPLARAAGFPSVAADLMFGLPGQSPDDWRESLDTLLALGPDHVSCYALTVEPFTPFGHKERRGELQRPDDDATADLFEEAHRRLTGAGFEHYEVSSYARRGARAVHNGLYWTQGSYLGVGCAAASFRPLAEGGGWRFTNPRATETYLRRAEAQSGQLAPAHVEWRGPADLEAEALWLALRTSDGLDRLAHQRAFGADPLQRPSRAQAALDLARRGWLEVSPQRLRPTAEGLGFADELAARLWSD